MIKHADSTFLVFFAKTIISKVRVLFFFNVKVTEAYLVLTMGFRTTASLPVNILLILVKDTLERDGVYHIHLEKERNPHVCPSCESVTDKVHDYRTQKVQHTKIFSRDTVIFYRKRRYACACGKRFYEKNQLVERYQRQSNEFKQALSVELIHGKNFKDVAARFNTSPTTVMRRFDEIGKSYLKKTVELPSVIAIDEY